MKWGTTYLYKYSIFNPLNAELNPICKLLVLLGAHPILHVSRIRVNIGMFYIRMVTVVTNIYLPYTLNITNVPLCGAKVTTQRKQTYWFCDSIAAVGPLK